MRPARVSFCNDLSEAMNGHEPPTCNLLKSTSQVIDIRWAIYVLVLKKNSIVKIYIGSGTASRGGVAQLFDVDDNALHLSQFDHKKSKLPSGVAEAVRDGFVIVHKGLLAWCSIPTTIDAARVRLLLVAIEAALSFQFWGMRPCDNE